MFAIVVKILFLILLLQVVFVIILENRNPYKTTSWILIMTLFPVLGIILYIYFGQEKRRKYYAQKKVYSDLKEQHPAMFALESNCKPSPKYEKLMKLLRNINDSVLLSGNEIEFFSDGKDKFERFFEDIKQAKHHVHILYYKFVDDCLGNKLRTLLIEKAKEGIAVRVIYDDLGSLKTKRKFFDAMKKEGVEVETFSNIRFPKLAQTLNYRNHKKLAVIDGKIGYIGGMNIADCYVEGTSWGIWRDMQVRIEGNGTRGLQRDFLKDWYFTHHQLPDLSYLFPRMNKHNDAPLQIVSSGPIDKYNSIERGIFQAINMAKKTIYLETPYFVPSESVLTALQTASVSGVNIFVIMPRKSDNFFLDGANHSFIKDLLRYGIHVFLYEAGFIHSKCTIIDEELTIMGSANMDLRSFELSFESDVFIYDKETTRKAVAIFKKDMNDSTLIEKPEWKKRPLKRRLFESTMRLFSPLL